MIQLEAIALEERATTQTDLQPALPDARQRAILCARTAADSRGRDVLVLDMTKVVDWVDYLVVASGTSKRQMTTIADEVEDALAAVGDRRIGIEGRQSGSWIVLDYSDILIHVFNDQTRDYYQLEHLWADAPRVRWEPPTQSSDAAEHVDRPSEQAEQQPHSI